MDAFRKITLRPYWLHGSGSIPGMSARRSRWTVATLQPSASAVSFGVNQSRASRGGNGRRWRVIFGCGSFGFEARALFVNRIAGVRSVHGVRMRGISTLRRGIWRGYDDTNRFGNNTSCIHRRYVAPHGFTILPFGPSRVSISPLQGWTFLPVFATLAVAWEYLRWRTQQTATVSAVAAGCARLPRSRGLAKWTPPVGT